MPIFESLSDQQLLAAAEGNVLDRRQAELDRLLITLAWCDRHGEDPQRAPGAVPARQGGDRLRRIGGEGTPEVAELTLLEMAIAQGIGKESLRNRAADALDLRHRLPQLHELTLALRFEPWLARWVARKTRALSRAAAAVVDDAVVAIRDESPSWIQRVVEAKVIAVDPEAHRERIARDDARQGVWVSRPRVGDQIDEVAAEPATRRISAKLPTGAALELDETVEDLADALAAHAAQDLSRDQLRAQALELLAHPHAAVAFLEGLAGDDEPSPEPGRRARRRPAVIHVHLSVVALQGRYGVARVEGVGPLLLEQLEELLRRRDVRLQPVLDLNTVGAVDGYEHPASMRERVLQRTRGDVFPHRSGLGMRDLDLDHIEPYDPTGPPGQTNDLNTAPLKRAHHRAKTHLGYQLHRLALDAYRWTTPHGLVRVVTPRGTAKVEAIRDAAGRIVGEIYAQPP